MDARNTGRSRRPGGVGGLQLPETETSRGRLTALGRCQKGVLPAAVQYPATSPRLLMADGVDCGRRSVGFFATKPLRSTCVAALVCRDPGHHAIGVGDAPSAVKQSASSFLLHSAPTQCRPRHARDAPAPSGHPGRNR